jgi:hypothetical protein
MKPCLPPDIPRSIVAGAKKVNYSMPLNIPGQERSASDSARKIPTIGRFAGGVLGGCH